MIQLLRGNYKSGLENYEFRFKKKKPSTIHGKAKIERYNNKKLKKNKSILIISEQGLGDTLQFMRYIPYLKKQGFDVYFSAQKKLHELIKISNIDKNPLTPEKTAITCCATGIGEY